MLQLDFPIPGRGLASPWGSSSRVPGEGVGGEARGEEGHKPPFLADIPASCGEARALGQHILPTAGVPLL